MEENVDEIEKIDNGNYFEIQLNPKWHDNVPGNRTWKSSRNWYS